MEVVTNFLFLGSKITVDGDCNHEIKRHLLLGRKVMTNLDSVLKSRDITQLIKVCTVKVMAFPVVTNGCESWTVKKVERQRTDAFKLFSSVQFSRSVMSDYLQPHRLQHASLPCPSPTLGAYSKLMSIELMMSIQPSHPLLSPSPSAFNLSQHQGLFK